MHERKDVALCDHDVRRSEGAAYLENVHRLRRRYIRNQDSSPAWDFQFVRALRQERLRAADAITREAASDGPAQEDSKP